LYREPYHYDHRSRRADLEAAYRRLHTPARTIAPCPFCYRLQLGAWPLCYLSHEPKMAPGVVFRGGPAPVTAATHGCMSAVWGDRFGATHRRRADPRWGEELEIVVLYAKPPLVREVGGGRYRGRPGGGEVTAHAVPPSNLPPLGGGNGHEGMHERLIRSVQVHNQTSSKLLIPAQ
jgi:hypothetical protein